jgi:hypothetical protein
MLSLPIICAVFIDFDRVRFFLLHSLDSYPRLQATEMNNNLVDCAYDGDLERVEQLVEGGANIDETNEDGMTALMMASFGGYFEIVVYLVEHGANVAHTDSGGMTALHWACEKGSLPTVELLLEHGATSTDRDSEGMTPLLHAADYGCLEVLQHLLSSEGGASITETNNEGNTALLLAAGAGVTCHPSIVQWLLEHGGAQITDTGNDGTLLWTVPRHGLPDLLKSAYTEGDDGEYVPSRDMVEITAVLRVMVLHDGPPASLVAELAPPLQQIVQDGARLRARLPAYRTQRRALLNAHCPLLPPLRDLVHGYEEPTTTDELWATGLGAAL